MKISKSEAMTVSSKNDSPRSAWLLLGDTLIRYRLFILFLAHAVLFAGIFWIAFLMRFTFSVPDVYIVIFWQSLPFVIATKLVTFFALQSFHGWWRHVNFSDFILLAKSSLMASFAVISIDYFLVRMWQQQLPRTVVLNDLAMTIIVLGGLRSCWRLWDERIAPLDPKRIQSRALLIGNPYEAARVAHLINGQYSMGIRIVGLVSAVEYPKGRRYSDLRIVGKVDEIASLMKLHRTNTLFVITGTMQGKDLRDLLDSAADLDFEIKILPPLKDQLQGLDKVPIREVAYNDLLRRKPVELDFDSIEHVIKNKTILVTGAGGSIGSELCRQILKFNPRKIILLGRGENRIYAIERELRNRFSQINIVPRIANITDDRRINEIFFEFKPELVFHAAAHKHVPLVEQNVGESIVNNVLGTKVMADAAHKYGSERFVMVSTDKAVNPTSVMGCTKQMAERYCQALDGKSDTMFISTRFGNVLGSAGSVVPLFQQQIRRGGPITVTDKRMTRYFMTIPEASQLVVQASAMGRGGEIFVLEMGEAVKIVDLANDLIRLAGHSVGSIEIVETGVRPGEKLYEELYYENEQSMPTAHDKILSSYCRMFELDEVNHQVQSLVDAAFESPNVIKGVLKEMIPEFKVEIAEPPKASRPSNLLL